MDKETQELTESQRLCIVGFLTAALVFMSPPVGLSKALFYTAQLIFMLINVVCSMYYSKQEADALKKIGKKQNPFKFNSYNYATFFGIAIGILILGR